MNFYKIVFLILLIFLWSCSNEVEISNIKEDKTNTIKCSKDFQIWKSDFSDLKLKAVVESDNILNITSSRDGIVSFLDCDTSKKITKNTLLATIKPDYNSINTKSIISQKESLKSQIVNTESMITQTKSNFTIQIDSLNNQIKDLNIQIENQNINLENLKNQKTFWVWDLKSQKASLKEQELNIEKQITLLEKSKQDDLEKIQISINNSRTWIKTLIWNILVQIDELYWITDKNKNLNDSFEIYLWAKNSSLKSKIENDFRELNNDFTNLLQKDNEDFLFYIDSFLLTLEDIKISIKDSVSSSSFSQTQIDNYYQAFLSNANSLYTNKATLEWFIKSLTNTENNYLSNIQSLQTQIDTVKTNIENIDNNKIDSYTSSIDSSINNIQIQINNLKTNIDNISSQIESLKSQEEIQISNYKNQIVSLKNNISNIDIQLSPLNIYSPINGTIKEKQISSWNKITPQNTICQIIPETHSQKLKIYSPVELDIWQEISFDFDNEIVVSKIVKWNSSKDNLTQNYIYESDYIDLKNLKEQEIIQVNIKNNIDKIKDDIIKDIFIPIDFVINKIDGYYLRKKDEKDNIDEIKIEIWNINWNLIEIKSWLSIWDNICR